MFQQASNGCPIGVQESYQSFQCPSILRCSIEGPYDVRTYSSVWNDLS